MTFRIEWTMKKAGWRAQRPDVPPTPNIQPLTETNLMHRTAKSHASKDRQLWLDPLVAASRAPLNHD